MPSDTDEAGVRTAQLSPLLTRRAYLLDRDGELFRALLYYMRTSRITVPVGHSLEDLREEAAYYCVALPDAPAAQIDDSIQSDFLLFRTCRQNAQ